MLCEVKQLLSYVCVGLLSVLLLPSIAMTTLTGIRHGSSVHLVIRQSKTAQSPTSSSQPSAAGTSTSMSTSVRAGRGVDCVSVMTVL